MKQGYLSQYFESVAAKRLSAVEADTDRSNQHEFNGTKELKSVFGAETGEPTKFDATFIWLGEVNEGLSSEGFVTWYDSRLNHPTRSEYRLYFPTNEVTDIAAEGDMLFIAKRTDGSVMIIITSANSTIENQLLWLFGLPIQTGFNFEMQEFENGRDVEIDFIVRFIFDELGIEIEEPETDRLDAFLEKFGGVFPTTKIFSAFARETLEGVNPLDGPDDALMLWMDQEERLFRRLERHIVDSRLREGFVNDGDTDVDGFISFSLSIQNRRKSRAGYALENHLEEIFTSHRISYSREKQTENKAKPDFLFPSVDHYHNPQFNAQLLTMLGAKTTCKDRWRQVLTEANRISHKHLLTLEPGISEAQTNEMKLQKLQLVIPEKLIKTYSGLQQNWLLNLSDFLLVVKGRQIAL